MCSLRTWQSWPKVIVLYTQQTSINIQTITVLQIPAGLYTIIMCRPCKETYNSLLVFHTSYWYRTRHSGLWQHYKYVSVYMWPYWGPFRPSCGWWPEVGTTDLNKGCLWKSRTSKLSKISTGVSIYIYQGLAHAKGPVPRVLLTTIQVPLVLHSSVDHKFAWCQNVDKNSNKDLLMTHLNSFFKLGLQT